MEDEKSEKHSVKKKKLGNLKESLLHKKFSKKMKKLQKNKLFRNKGLNDLPIIEKKKKQSLMKRDEMGKNVYKDNSALPQSATIDCNIGVAKQRSEILQCGKNDEQFVDALKTKKKSKKKSKPKESLSREGSDQVLDSDSKQQLTRTTKEITSVENERHQGKQKKKKKKQVNTGETLLRPIKPAKVIPKTDISSVKSRSKRKKLKMKRTQ